MNKFGEKLRTWRESKSVSNWTIEKLTGVSRANLSSIEKGRRAASDDVLLKLSSIPELGITYEELRSWQILDNISESESEKMAIIKALGKDYALLSYPSEKVKPTEFAKQFSWALKEAGLTPRQLANKVDIAPELIDEVITGQHSPSEEEMKAFLDVPELSRAGLNLMSMQWWKQEEELPTLNESSSDFITSKVTKRAEELQLSKTDILEAYDVHPMHWEEQIRYWFPVGLLCDTDQTSKVLKISKAEAELWLMMNNFSLENIGKAINNLSHEEALPILNEISPDLLSKALQRI